MREKRIFTNIMKTKNKHEIRKERADRKRKSQEGNMGEWGREGEKWLIFVLNFYCIVINNLIFIVI